MRPIIRSTSAALALADTEAAFANGLGPLAVWGSDELRLEDGTTLVAGIRRSSDGGELVGCWRIHHMSSGGVLSSYNLDACGLRPVEERDENREDI